MLRAQILATRARLPDAARARASAVICARLTALPALAGARTLAAFAPLPQEVAIEPFLLDRITRGVGVFLPFMDDSGELELCRVQDLDADLTRGWRGVREPRAHLRRPARVDRVEAFLAPGAAFDLAGGRLGHGGGHYDRLLARASQEAYRVGVAFDVQIVDRVPTEDHDVRMHRILTERRIVEGELPVGR